MDDRKTIRRVGPAVVMAGWMAVSLSAGAGEMSFFVTSAGPGNGADLGGLAGADAHCQSLAESAGAGGRSWRAYLSTQGKSLTDADVVHARERIGSGPWVNAKGEVIASDVAALHAGGAMLGKAHLLDEKGNPVNGRSEKPNRHDILTGSRPDGTAFPPSPPFGDTTCGNWTKSGEDGSAIIGHHDLAGPTGDAWATSWNSAHPTRGCSQQALRSTGGDGLFYCFAAD